MTITPVAILNQIKALTADLISLSICNRQMFPAIKNHPDGIVDVTISNHGGLSVTLKNIPYADIYAELDATSTYNIKMVDGALIQMMYRFSEGELVSHRLAFFPCPDLSEYQNSPEIYESDELYAEVIARNIVSVPVRFDFDKNCAEELHHPSSHLTLGQYANCRIPVGAPVTPFVFMDFILRSFYNTAHRRLCTSLTKFNERFPLTIAKPELDVLHVVPGAMLQ